MPIDYSMQPTQWVTYSPDSINNSPNLLPGASGIFVGRPADLTIESAKNFIATKAGLADLTVNGHSIAGLALDYATQCVETLRKGTVAHIAKLQDDIQKLRMQLAMNSPSATDPITGRTFREDAE